MVSIKKYITDGQYRRDAHASIFSALRKFERAQEKGVLAMAGGAQAELERQTLPTLQFSSVRNRAGKSRQALSEYETMYATSVYPFRGINFLVSEMFSAGMRIEPGNETPLAASVAQKADDWLTIAEFKDGPKARTMAKNAFVYGTAWAEMLAERKGNRLVYGSQIDIVSPLTMDMLRTTPGDSLAIITDVKDPEYGNFLGFCHKLQNNYTYGQNRQVNFVPVRMIDAVAASWQGSSFGEVKWSEKERIIVLKFFDIGDDPLGISILQPAFDIIKGVMDLDDGLREATFRMGYPRTVITYGSDGKPATPQMGEDVEKNMKDLAAKDLVKMPHPNKIDILNPGPGNMEPAINHFVEETLSLFGIPKHAFTGIADGTNVITAREQNKKLKQQVKDFQRMYAEMLRNQVLARVFNMSPHDPNLPKVIFGDIMNEEDIEFVRLIKDLASPPIGGGEPMITFEEARIMLEEHIDIPNLKDKKKTKPAVEKPQDPSEEKAVMARRTTLSDGSHEKPKMSRNETELAFVDPRFVETLADEKTFERKLLDAFIAQQASVKEQVLEGETSPKIDIIPVRDIIANEDARLWLKGEQKGQADVRKKQALAERKVPPEILDRILVRAGLTAAGIKKTLESQIAKHIADGIALGLGMEDIARNILKDYGDMTRSKALQVARTETQYAVNNGRLTAYQDEGIKSAIFLAAPDADGGDPEGECVVLNGKTFGTLEAQEKIPVHPNCRCTWIPVVEGA